MTTPDDLIDAQLAPAMTTLDDLIDAQLAADAEAERKAEEERQERVRVNKATAIAKIGERLFWSLGKDLFDLLPLEYEAFTFREVGAAYYNAGGPDDVHRVIASFTLYQDHYHFTYWPTDSDSEFCDFFRSGTACGCSTRETVLRELAKAREFDRAYPIECVPA